MEEQLSRLSRREAGADLAGIPWGESLAGLFLDLPLGVHPGGFDSWRWPEVFVSGISTGAPPDSFFSGGQDWNFHPLHPERIRERGHQYLARSVHHHMRHANYLRVDHVMSLHRLFWVPEGMSPKEGVYVAYPSEESYAVLAVESHRNRTLVVGEDLGTVPAGVRASMRRHGVLGTWVMQSSMRSRGPKVVGAVPRCVVASLNTHDMFPFAGFPAGRRYRSPSGNGATGPGASQSRDGGAAAHRGQICGDFACRGLSPGPEPAHLPEAGALARGRGAHILHGSSRHRARPSSGPRGAFCRALAFLGMSEAALVGHQSRGPVLRDSTSELTRHRGRTGELATQGQGLQSGCQAGDCGCGHAAPDCQGVAVAGV